MGHPQLAAFSRLAKENTPPTRVLAGQNTLIGRNQHEVWHEPIRDELFLPNGIPQSIQVYRGGANGDEAPIRVIQGPKTELVHPLRMTIDPLNKEIIVPDILSVLVFPIDGNGDIAPKRKLNHRAGSAAVDPIHDLLVLVSAGGRTGPSIRIFDRTASGDEQPRAVISGPHTGLESTRQITLNPERGWIIVSQTLQNDEWEPGDYLVGVWSINDKGDVPPRWKIGGPKTTMVRARGVALNPKHKELIVGDMVANAVFTFYFPEIF
ncbi:MAG: hypothetical protein HY647_00370 [Acidobacteria bacterium]|nr:hypothetical protein [Acidobacteriota bacterium]